MIKNTSKKLHKIYTIKFNLATSSAISKSCNVFVIYPAIAPTTGVWACRLWA